MSMAQRKSIIFKIISNFARKNLNWADHLSDAFLSEMLDTGRDYKNAKRIIAQS